MPKDLKYYRDIAIVAQQNQRSMLKSEYEAAADKAYHGGGCDADNHADSIESQIREIENWLTEEGVPFKPFDPEDPTADDED